MFLARSDFLIWSEIHQAQSFTILVVDFHKLCRKMIVEFGEFQP